MMSISIERLMAVYKPIHFKTYHVSRSRLAHFLTFILPAVLMAVTLNVPKYFEIGYVMKEVSKGTYSRSLSSALLNIYVNI